MREYRPKGWENPYTYKDLVARPKSDTIDTINLPEMIAFESGASAMLEALKERGSLMTPEQMKLLAPDRLYGHGWLVFIPDEVEK